MRTSNIKYRISKLDDEVFWLRVAEQRAGLLLKKLDELSGFLRRSEVRDQRSELTADR